MSTYIVGLEGHPMQFAVEAQDHFTAGVAVFVSGVVDFGTKSGAVAVTDLASGVKLAPFSHFTDATQFSQAMSELQTREHVAASVPTVRFWAGWDL